jgi:hypothetical protein
MLSCLPLSSKSHTSIFNGLSRSPLHKVLIPNLVGDHLGFRELSMTVLFQTCVYELSSLILRSWWEKKEKEFGDDLFVVELDSIQSNYLEMIRNGSDFPKNPSLFANFTPEKVTIRLSLVLVCDSPRISTYPLWLHMSSRQYSL